MAINVMTLEYFLNAVHYGIYQMLVSLHYRHIRFVLRIAPNRYKVKIQSNVKKSEWASILNPINGFAINMAHHQFGFFSAAYAGCISLVLLGGICSFIGYPLRGKIMSVIILVVPILICYVPVCKYVFKNERYLKFFKQFEKKDARWHKKWKWIAIAYCIGGIFFFILGIIICFSLFIHTCK